MRVMLDTNVFDRLDADPEAASELEDRRDLRLFVSEVQLAQLGAIPDEARRGRYLELAMRLCSRVSAAAARAARTSGSARADATRAAPTTFVPAPDRHEPDRMIAAAAAARCDLLVTDDAGLLEYARGSGVRAMDWASFVARVVFAR